jgi:hypothetical protein
MVADSTFAHGQKSCFKTRRYFLALALLLTSMHARADVLFEGFYKVMLEDTHVGYVIQRFEFDPKKKEFTTAYFLKTNAAGGNLSESLKARATAGFRPVNYQYTSVQGDQTRTIDAAFKGETMTAQVTEGSKHGVITKKVPKEVFLASFLGYVMLQGKEGMKKGLKYSYRAIAEEDADIQDGEAFVASDETMNAVSTFKVLNTFKKTKFVSWVTHKGEVIATASPLQKISTELVPTFQEATANQSVSTKTLEFVFGTMPRGKDNVIARRASETANTATPPLSKQKQLEQKPESSGLTPKTEGIPGGKGIMIKGAPSQKGANEKPEAPQPATPAEN